MKKHVLCVVLVMVVLMGALSHAATLNVNWAFPDPLQAGQYHKISAAMKDALSGDTVMVSPGNYDDAVLINKELITLQGAGTTQPTISNTVTIEGANVTISGFTISSHTGCGIVIPNPTKGIKIKNNCLVGNFLDGIAFGYDSGALLENNTIADNTRYGISSGFTTVAVINNIIVSNDSGAISASGLTFSNNYIMGSASCGTPCTKLVIATAPPLFISGTNYALQNTSPCRNAGKVGATYLNPDGTQNDMGAYGGPGATSFWPYGYGPIVTSISTSPPRIEKGGSITINATATAR